MILTCPSCRTKYVVPDSAIGLDGRKVRCAQCRFSWFQDGPEAMPTGTIPPPAPPPAPRQPAPPPVAVEQPPEEQAPQPEAIDWAPAEPEAEAYQEEEEEEAPRRARRNPARLWTWIAIISALLMVGALTAIYFIGPQQISAWMNGGGAAISPSEALRISRQNLSREPLPTDRELFTVTGEITNVSNETQRIPQIRAEVTDADQNVIFSWMIAPPVSELAAGQAITFSGASTEVPRGGRSLSLRFGSSP